MELRNYKAAPKEGALKGTFDLYMPKWGGTMRRMKHFQKNGHDWINFPDQEYEKDGKKAYFSYWRFDTEDMKKAFDARVMEQIRALQVVKPAFQCDEQEELPF